MKEMGQWRGVCTLGCPKTQENN